MSGQQRGDDIDDAQEPLIYNDDLPNLNKADCMEQDQFTIRFKRKVGLSTAMTLLLTLSGLLLLNLKLDEFPADFAEYLPYSMVAVPFLVGLGILAAMVMCIFNDEEDTHETFSKVMFVSITYGSFALIFTFTVAFALRAEERISIEYIYVFMPLYLQLVNIAGFLCYYIPGMTDTRIALHREALLTVTYYAFFLAFVILTSLPYVVEGLSIPLHVYFSLAFAPLMAHYLILMVAKCCCRPRREETEGSIITEVVLLTAVTLFVALAWLKVSGVIGPPWVIILLPLYTFFIRLLYTAITYYLNRDQ